MIGISLRYWKDRNKSITKKILKEHRNNSDDTQEVRIASMLISGHVKLLTKRGNNTKNF